MPAKFLVLFLLVISLGCGDSGGGSNNSGASGEVSGGGDSGGGSTSNGIPTTDFDITGSWMMVTTVTSTSGDCGPDWTQAPVGFESTSIWEFQESGSSVSGQNTLGYDVTGVITEDQYQVFGIVNFSSGTETSELTLIPLDCGSMIGSLNLTYVETPFSCSTNGSIIMTRIGPCPPGSVNPFADVDNDGISNDCDVDHTGGQDCDFDGQDDNCQVDSDGNGIIDPCES